MTLLQVPCFLMTAPSATVAIRGERSAEEPTSIYATDAFLEVIADVYFPSSPSCIKSFVISGQVFRLLTVSGIGPIVHQTFLDMHESQPSTSDTLHYRRLNRLDSVSRGLMKLDEFKRNQEWQEQFAAPTTLWAGFPTWQDYRALLRKRNILADDERRLRRLKELLGDVTFSEHDVAEEVLPTCFEWKSLRDRNVGRAELFADEKNRNFFRVLQERGLLRASTLRAGGRLLAIWLGAVYQERWNGWVIAHTPDPALAKLSPGRQLLYPMLERSYRAGHREFDFSIGIEPYKLFFATHVRIISPVGRPSLHVQLASAVKSTLRRNRWVYEKLRSVHNLYSHRGVAKAARLGH